jgi:hypothetical protein
MLFVIFSIALLMEMKNVFDFLSALSEPLFCVLGGLFLVYMLPIKIRDMSIFILLIGLNGYVFFWLYVFSLIWITGLPPWKIGVSPWM